MSNKVLISKQKEFKFVMKACVAATLLAACGVACATTGVFNAGYNKIDTSSGTRKYVGDDVDVSATYKANYPDGVVNPTTDAVFRAKGFSSTKYEWTPAHLRVDADEILVTGAKKGAFAEEAAEITLGGDAKLIRFETSGAGVDVRSNSKVSLSANNIVLKSENKDVTLRAAYVQAGSTTSSLELSAKEGITLETKVSGATSEAEGLYVTSTSNKDGAVGVNFSADRVGIRAEIDSNKTSGKASGIYAKTYGGSIVVNGNTVDIVAKSNKNSLGIDIDNNYERGTAVKIGSDTSSNVSISAEADLTAIGMSINNTSKNLTGGTNSATILGKSINITAIGKNATGADLWGNSTLFLGSADSAIQLKIEAETEGYGLAAQTGSDITVNGKTLEIESTGSTSVGIHAQNNTTDATDGFATVTVNSAKTVIKANTALSAMSQGRIYVNGDLETESKNAILARGNAIVSVNEKGGNTVKLTGDINFNYDQNTSGTTTDATVIVNLDNAASSWTGNAKTSVSSGTPSAALIKSNISLGLTNGASWTPTAIDTSLAESKAASINSLTISDGVINLKTGGASEVKVQELSGTGGTVNVDMEKAADSYKPVGGLVIDSVKSGNTPQFTVNATGITADDVSNEETTMSNLIGVVDGKDDAPISVTANVAEGAVKGAITATQDADGNVTRQQAQNTKLASLNTVNAMAVMAWRHDMNDLGKRMGELRDTPAGVGSWVRFFGSNQEYSKGGVTSKRTSIQMGADTDVGFGWKVGSAFTYTDGTSDLDNGSADNKGYGLAAYGTWIADNGLYVDLIGRYSRLSSDFTINEMQGKSKNNAWSASAEAGWHAMVTDFVFVEPQAELSYGIVAGDTFTTSNGVKVSQDDAKALVGRLGLRTGLQFPDKKGMVYARASVLHDFKGDTGFTASLVNDASVNATFKDDVGGTYYEMGVGANFNWTPNTYTYLDLERQNGGEIKENWRWNVGFRYVW